MAVVCPAAAAYESAVLPLLFLASASKSLLTKRRTISVIPPLAASDKAFQPWVVLPFGECDESKADIMFMSPSVLCG